MQYNIKYTLLNTETGNVITTTDRNNPVHYITIDIEIRHILRWYHFNNTKFKLESIQINATKNGKDDSR